MQISQAQVLSFNSVPLNRKPLPLIKVIRLLLKNSVYVLEQLLPGGKLVGEEYKACNPLRDDTGIGSFSINTRSGVWADFATDDKGGSLVELFGYLNSIEDQEQLLLELDEFCHLHTLTTQKRMPAGSLLKAKKKLPTDLIPAEEMRLLPPAMPPATASVSSSKPVLTKAGLFARIVLSSLLMVLLLN